MKVFNGTDQPIKLYRQEDVRYCDFTKRLYLVKSPTEPYWSIPYGLYPLMVNYQETTCTIQERPFLLVSKERELIGVTYPPSNYDLLIVTPDYKEVCKTLGMDTSKMATMSNLVYDPGDMYRPLGCLELAL